MRWCANHVAIWGKRITGRENKLCKDPVAVGPWLVGDISMRSVVERSDSSMKGILCKGPFVAPV